MKWECLILRTCDKPDIININDIEFINAYISGVLEGTRIRLSNILNTNIQVNIKNNKYIHSPNCILEIIKGGK